MISPESLSRMVSQMDQDQAAIDDQVRAWRDGGLIPEFFEACAALANVSDRRVVAIAALAELSVKHAMARLAMAESDGGGA